MPRLCLSRGRTPTTDPLMFSHRLVPEDLQGVGIKGTNVGAIPPGLNPGFVPLQLLMSGKRLTLQCETEKITVCLAGGWGIRMSPVTLLSTRLSVALRGISLSCCVSRGVAGATLFSPPRAG